MSALSELLLTDIPTTCWLGLFMQDPALVQDPITVEILSKSYSREEVLWTKTTTTLTTTALLLWTDIPIGTLVVAMGVFNKPVNGDLLFTAMLPAPMHFTRGGSLSYNGATITVPA